MNYWEKIYQLPYVKIIFVNDGSTDETLNVLQEFQERLSVTILNLIKNVGKAEAVRLGLLEGMKSNPVGVGFLDADGAFDLEDIYFQISKFRDFLAKDSPTAVWSSRVNLSGRNIDRNPIRHWIARFLLTYLAWALDFKIYDTQSGFKLFPNSPTMKICLENQFKTRWFVDLEIFLRWRAVHGSSMPIWEEPVRIWRDIKGSKLNKKQYLRVFVDLLRLRRY